MVELALSKRYTMWSLAEECWGILRQRGTSTKLGSHIKTWTNDWSCQLTGEGCRRISHTPLATWPIAGVRGQCCKGSEQNKDASAWQCGNALIYLSVYRYVSTLIPSHLCFFNQGEWSYWNNCQMYTFTCNVLNGKYDFKFNRCTCRKTISSNAYKAHFIFNVTCLIIKCCVIEVWKKSPPPPNFSPQI